MGRKLCIVFVDLKKVFNRVAREVTSLALRRIRVLERETRAVKEVYIHIKTFSSHGLDLSFFE